MSTVRAGAPSGSGRHTHLPPRRVPGVPTPLNGRTLAMMVFVALMRAQDQTWVSRVARVAGPDFWLAVAAGWAGGLVLVGLMLAAGLACRGLPPRRALPALFGPLLGGLLQVVLILYLVLEVGHILRTGVSMVHYAVLPRTPTWILTLMGVVPALLLLGGGLAAVARFHGFVFIPTLVFGVVQLLLGARFSDFGNLFPILARGPAPVLAGAAGMLEPVLGAEVLLALLPAMLAAGLPVREAVAGTLAGAALRAGLYFLDAVLLQTAFGPFILSEMYWPLLEVTRRTYLPGLFFERFDLFLLMVLLVAASAAAAQYLWAAWWLLQGLGARGHVWEALLLAVLGATVAWLPGAWDTALRLWELWLRPVGLLIHGAALLVVLAAAWRRWRHP